MGYHTCPRCRLSVRTRFASLTVQYCPRCLARRRSLVELRDTTGPPTSARVVDQPSRSTAQQVAFEHGEP